MAESEANGALLPASQDDDFRKIKKITQPVARALYELEIRRYADLAALTPGILADLLRAKNVHFVSAQRIEREDWIGQAGLLAGTQAENAVPEEQAAPAPGAGADPAPENLPAGPARHAWRELADFFVSFGEEVLTDGKAKLKTKAHFSQGDLPFERDGIAMGELVEWMLKQANLTVVEEEPHAPSAEQQREDARESERAREIGPAPGNAPVLGEEAQHDEHLPLLVSNLWVSEVNRPASAGRQNVERMIRVEADIDVSPETAVYLIGPTPFMMSIYLVNTETNASIFIDTPSVTVSLDMLPYAFQHDFPIPPPGRYQLYLLAGLPSAGKAPFLQQGPIVRVEG